MAGFGNIGALRDKRKNKPERGSITSKDFIWSLGYVWRYRPLLITGLVFAVLHSVFYTAGISALLPVLKLLIENEGVHAWVYRAIAEHRTGAHLSTLDPRLDASAAATGLAGLPTVRRVDADSSLAGAGIAAGDVLLPAGELPGDLPVEARTLAVYSALAHGTGPADVIVTQTQSPGDRRTVAIPRDELAWYLTPALVVLDQFEPSVTRDERLNELVSILAFLLMVSVVGNVMRFLAEYLVAKATFAGMVDLRRDMYAKALRLPMSFYARNLSDTTSRFVQDTAHLSRSILLLFGKVAREPLKAIGALVVLLVVDYRLLLLVALGGVPAYLVIKRAGRMVNRATQRLLSRYGDMLQKLEATFLGLRVVKSYNAEEYEAGRFAEIDRGMLRQFKTLAKVEAAMPPIIETVTLLAASAGMIWLASQVMAGVMSAGEFMAMGVLLAALFDPVRKIATVWNRVQGGGAAAERIKQLIDTPDERDLAPGTIELPALSESIRFEDVSFTYPGGESPALAGVNLEIRRGEKVAIVGPNGSGKTTLVSLLPRFYTPSAGRILWDGVDIASVRLESLRKHIGLVSQDTVVFPMTVRDNIAYARSAATDEGVLEAATRARAAEFILDPRSCPNGLLTELGEGGSGLSGGQRQRVALARLILRDSPVVILDEATSAADAHSEQLIAQALNEFTRDKTVLIIAHRFATVQTVDRIVVMEAGRVLDQGPHAELIERCGLYQRLCELQLVA